MIYTDLSPEERDRLRAAYEAGFSAGSGSPWMLGDDRELIALLDAVVDDWFRSLETRQAVHRIDFPLLAPEWLRAYAERQIALGDATPPKELRGQSD
jgi:hypothetical protein